MAMNSEIKTEIKKVVRQFKTAQKKFQGILDKRAFWVDEARKFAQLQSKEVKKLVEADVKKVRSFLEKEMKELDKYQKMIPSEVKKIHKFVGDQRKHVEGLLKNIKTTRKSPIKKSKPSASSQPTPTTTEPKSEEVVTSTTES